MYPPASSIVPIFCTCCCCCCCCASKRRAQDARSEILNQRGGFRINAKKGFSVRAPRRINVFHCNSAQTNYKKKNLVALTTNSRWTKAAKLDETEKALYLNEIICLHAKKYCVRFAPY